MIVDKKLKSKKKELNEKLEKARSELDKLIADNADKEEILKKSQEVDIYIMEVYNEHDGKV